MINKMKILYHKGVIFFYGDLLLENQVLRGFTFVDLKFIIF